MIINILRKLEVNRAVLYNSLSQGWSILAGPVTMLLIAYRLSAEEQGYYYTFSSVLALEVFVELGLVTVIVQVASHEWAFLQRDTSGRIVGDTHALSRLASLTRFALRWYFVCGLIIMGALSAGGYLFFLSRPHPEIAWQIPWFLLCFMAGLALMMSPVFSIIEGCNQVDSIYSFRFVQGALSSLAVIGSISLGFGLYALAIAAVVRFAAGIAYLLVKYFVFLKQLLTCAITSRIDWLEEVWPFQWRIGISWLSGYFIFSIFTPVMFYYHGPTVAGQMGMTWGIIVMIESVSNAWLNTRMPLFGILIAQHNYAELDRIFRRLFLITVGIAATLALILWVVYFGLQASDLEIRRRLLPMLPMTLFLLHRIINVAVSAMALYLRAHKQEPMMIPSVIGALLAGPSTWLLGAAYGPTGAAAGILAIGLIWGIPSTCYVFTKYRKKWHSEPGSMSIDRVVLL